MLGLIRVLTLEDRQAVELHGRIIARHHHLAVRSMCIPDQPNGIFDEETMATATPKVVAAAIQLEQEGCEQIAISCFGDPALDEARRSVGVPVFSAGSAAAHLACAASHRIGVLTLVDELPDNVARILGDSCVGLHKPMGVRTVLDLMTTSGRDAAVAGANRLVMSGADTILLGCTGFSTMDFATDIGDKISARLIDPLVALGACIAATVRSPTDVTA